MIPRQVLFAAFAAILTLGMPAFAQQPLIYPAKGQSADQQKKDQAECAIWATQQTGVDPVALAQQSAAVQSAPPPSGGQRVRGAARGAAAGAVVGEIVDDDAGEGAAAGAVVGTMASGAQKRRQGHAQATQTQQGQAQTQQALSNYNRAVGACMEGRGYVIK